MANDATAARARFVGRGAPGSTPAARIALCLLGAMLLTAVPSRAQPVLDTKQIVEALKPSPSRSLRNLVARDKSSDPRVGAPAQAPAIDLTIEFDFGSASVRAESRALLERLAEALQSPDLQNNKFLIEGHTDAVGSAASNLKLSVYRADEVRRILVVSGVMPSRVTTAGRGATQPVNAADPNAGENRRVRIVNLQ